MNYYLLLPHCFFNFKTNYKFLQKLWYQAYDWSIPTNNKYKQ